MTGVAPDAPKIKATRRPSLLSRCGCAAVPFKYSSLDAIRLPESERASACSWAAVMAE